MNKRAQIMSPIFSALMTSSLLIMFISFISTKIDQTVNWNWFLVFMPLFMLQTFYLIDVVALISKRRIQLKSLNLFAFAFGIVLIFSFEILLCLKLEYFLEWKLTFIFTPLWISFSMIIIYLFFQLAR